MGVNKLDIEFEDDEEIQAREEAERKKNEVMADVDLSFGAVDSEVDQVEATSEPKEKKSSHQGDESAGVREVSPEDKKEKKEEVIAEKKEAKPDNKEVPKEELKKEEVKPQEAEVKSISEARTPVQQAPAGQVHYQQIPQAQVMIGPDYKLGDELKKVAASNQILAIEIEARVKVEVAKEMTKTVADFHAQNKLLEHKVNKILNQMHQKAPALKNELMMIKKYLKEHSSLEEEDESSSKESSAQKSQSEKRPAKRPVKKKAA